MAQVRCPTCGRFMASKNPHDHAAQQDAPPKRMVLPPRRRRVPASVAMARAVVSPHEETRPDAPSASSAPYGFDDGGFEDDAFTLPVVPAPLAPQPPNAAFGTTSRKPQRPRMAVERRFSPRCVLDTLRPRNALPAPPWRAPATSTRAADPAPERSRSSRPRTVGEDRSDRAVRRRHPGLNPR